MRSPPPPRLRTVWTHPKKYNKSHHLYQKPPNRLLCSGIYNFLAFQLFLNYKAESNCQNSYSPPTHCWVDGLRLSKKFWVIPSQCAHWRGNPPVRRECNENHSEKLGDCQKVNCLKGKRGHPGVYQAAAWFAMTGFLTHSAHPPIAGWMGCKHYCSAFFFLFANSNRRRIPIKQTAINVT